MIRSKQSALNIAKAREARCKYPNWKVNKAIRMVFENDKAAIQSLGSKYPLFLNIASKIDNEQVVEMFDCFKDDFTVRRLEMWLRTMLVKTDPIKKVLAKDSKEPDKIDSEDLEYLDSYADDFEEDIEIDDFEVEAETEADNEDEFQDEEEEADDFDDFEEEPEPEPVKKPVRKRKAPVKKAPIEKEPVKKVATGRARKKPVALDDLSEF